MLDHLVLMCEHPQSCQELARLEPALGADGVRELQSRLLAQLTTTARQWSRQGHDRTVTVFCQGAAPTEFRALLGEDFLYERDSGGSHGARLAVASVRAFSRGADRVVLVGTTCPGLSVAQLERAFFTLEHLDLAVGPSPSGWYYLIGLVAPCPAVFANMPWGTGAVLSRTLAAARTARLRTGLLPALPMVHGPGDLVHAAHLVERPMPEDPRATSDSWSAEI